MQQVTVEELSDFYARELFVGKEPDEEEYLRRCPDELRKELSDAMRGARLYKKLIQLFPPPTLMDEQQKQQAVLRLKQFLESSKAA